MRARGIDPARLTHGAGRRGELADTTDSNAIGQLAQVRFEERCAALALDGRLWWLRVPDPMIPRGAPDARGRLLCQPQAREEGTDYLGAWMDRGGLLIGAEVKGTAKDVWRPRASLEPSQASALTKLARMGLPAIVWLYHLPTMTQHVIPWRYDEGGGQLACGVSMNLPDETWAVRAGEAWLDALARVYPLG